jgi:hypothetical protein
MERHFEAGIHRQSVGIIAVFVTGRNHQQPEVDNLGERVYDLIGRARVFNASGKTIGDAKPLFDLTEHQDTAIR